MGIVSWYAGGQNPVELWLQFHSITKSQSQQRANQISKTPATLTKFFVVGRALHHV